MACTDEHLAFLRSVVLEESSNLLDPARDHLFESRLQLLLDKTSLRTLDGLAAALCREPRSALRRLVAEAMTTNETSFFRDRAPFDLLRSELLPALVKERASERRLRLWSAACSSGQETYSLAMLLREYFPHLRDWQVEVLGSDISREMIHRAQAGCYRKSEVNRGLPTRYRIKYLQECDDEFQVVPEIRQMCHFHRRNLCEGPQPFERYDGILLRNVMLYFPAETRRRLLIQIHGMLCSDGFLLLGSSEQPDLPDHFQAVLKSNACYYRPIAAG
jgi:chemotaxis protein methyltransferase CheR